MSREDEVPSNAMYTAEGGTEDGKDCHAGIAITFGSWGVKRRNVCGARRDFVGCNDLKDSGQGE